jgi:hypothetical protein
MHEHRRGHIVPDPGGTMSKRLTRRELLKDVGAAGATTLFAVRSGAAISSVGPSLTEQDGKSATAQLAQASEGEVSASRTSQAFLGRLDNPLQELTAGDMIVALDRRYGPISSISRNYLRA